MIRVVVFDFDGTLVDSNEIKTGCLYRSVADLEGGADIMSEVRKLGGDRFAIFDEFARRYYQGADPQAISANSRVLSKRYGECCFRGIAAAAERRGAREALSALHRRGLKLWVLSATPVASLRQLLIRRNIHRWLRGSLGSPVNKVDGLRFIMRTESVQRHEVLMVGDGFDDQAAAHTLKTRFAGITLERSLNVRGRFDLTDLHRLPALIDDLGRRRSERS
jgi:phosphoglycolate phosphatase